MSTPLAGVAVALIVDDRLFVQGLNSAVNQAQSAGDQASKGFTARFGAAALQSSQNLMQAVFYARELGNMWSHISGMRVSAEFELAKRNLTRIDGSATNAADAFERLISAANTSSYDAVEVLDLGVRNASRLGSALEGAKRTGQLLDLATVFGVRRGGFDAFNVNLDQMFNKTDGQVNQVDVRQMLFRGPLALSAISQTLGVSLDEARKRLYSANGKQMQEILLAVAERNRGAAESAANADPFVALSNTAERFRNAMAPTGKALNQVLLLLLPLANGVGTAFDKLNTFTGGVFGLVAVLGIGVLGYYRTVRAATAAIGSINLLTLSIQRLAGASGSAAVANTAGNVASGAAAGATGGRLATAAKTVGKVVGGLLLAYMVWEIVKAAQEAMPMSEKKQKTAGLMFGGTAEQVRREGLMQGKSQTQLLQEVADNGKKTNQVLGARRAQAYGGGQATRSALTLMEMEYAAYHLMRASAAGVG